ncbi:hypothetical protein MASR1M32_10160 [Rhodobacter sp.]
MADPIQKKFRGTMNQIAAALDEAFNGPPKPGRKRTVGFILLTAEFGKIDNGRVNYISNGDRPDMLAMLREYLARAEGRVVEPEGGKPQ